MSFTYAVISDIHGSSKQLELALKLVDDNKASFIILLGDIINHGPRNGLPNAYDPMTIAEMLKPYASRIIAVKGNCDSEVDQMVLNFPIKAVCNQLIINNHRFFCTHGHIYKEENLTDLHLQANDAFLYGHTHVPVLRKTDEQIIIFNPGSITFPKGSPKIPTMGFITELGIKLVSVDENSLGNVLKSLSFIE